MHFVNAKSILSQQNGINLYRGCTHGCIYCDSRSLCYHNPIPFEDIEVKQNAAELLEDRLRRKREKCMIGTGAMCDPYMHCEKDLRLTRRRYEVLKEMQARGIPTIVWMTPDLPFINDTEENLYGILGYCKDAGVKGIIKFDFGVTLREGDREYLYKCFDKDFPGMKQMYQQKFGYAYQVSSPNRNQLMTKFRTFIRENNLLMDNQCFEYMHQFPQKEPPKPIQGELEF